MTDTSGRMSLTPFAYYDPESQCLRMSQGTLVWEWGTYSQTLPKSGSMRDGQLYEHPMPGPHTGGSGSSSLLPTPVTQNNENRQSDGYGPNLGTALLGTPRASMYDFDDRPHHRGQLEGQITHLLLPTPVADNSRGLPQPGSDYGSLPNALLPTPVVNDMGAGKTPQQWDEWTATMQTRHGNSNGHGPSLAIETQRGLGPYQAACDRWASIIGRPPPNPTTNGDKPRLNPEFVEWMMGLPAGHVTGHGISRNACLKALGNGVVPQQAALALAILDPHPHGGDVDA